ncbi:MAG: hypothetical protein KDB80_10305 [Planctomycetes bacterium]|nr:hypothetical protein [Planctomycetota bacterium]
MKALTCLATAALAVGSFAPEVLADGRKPGSVLIFPVHRSGGNWFTVLNVSNTATTPATPISFGGSTNLHFEYVNVQPNPNAAINPLDKFMPVGCTIFDRIEFLTPVDHISVLTTCHNAFGGAGQEGYVVVSAEDPTLAMGASWAHNYLIGSEVVMSAGGITYMVNAIPIRAPIVAEHTSTRSGGIPGYLRFDDVTYEALPDAVMSDFIGVANSQLTLINLTGGPTIENTIFFEVYNDNELPLSATLRFRCWFDCRLSDINPLFTEANLDNFPNDPQELDLDCDGNGELETGWFRIQSTGTWFAGGQQLTPDGVVVGAITAGHASVRGGHLLWESTTRQTNGNFRLP